MRTSPPLLSPLFRSEGQARLLAELFLTDEPELNISELADRAGVPYGSAHREVGRLLKAGLLLERRVGKARLISPNPDSPLTQPVRELVLVSAGPVPMLAKKLGSIGGVELAFLFGSFAARMLGEPGDSPQDIDLMVVGTPDPDEVYDACRAVGDVVGRPVNPVIMSRNEWERESGFLAQVKSSPTVAIIGGRTWE